jgi:hypothetical protein
MKQHRPGDQEFHAAPGDDPPTRVKVKEDAVAGKIPRPTGAALQHLAPVYQPPLNCQTDAISPVRTALAADGPLLDLLLTSVHRYSSAQPCFPCHHSIFRSHGADRTVMHVLCRYWQPAIRLLLTSCARASKGL